MINIRKISTIAIVAGMGLVAMSWVWPGLVGGRQNWNDQQADAYSQAAAELHSLTYQVGKAHGPGKQGASAGNSQAQLAERLLSKSAETGAPINPESATAERMAAQLVAAKGGAPARASRPG